MFYRKSNVALRSLIVLVLLLGILHAVTFAQSVVRIGVIDQVDGSIARGAYLAAKQINANGGIVGANRGAFELRIVVTSPNHPEIAAANMSQASVVAVLAPDTEGQALALMNELRNLNVPVITSASSDTILLQDTSQNMFRSSAQDIALNRVLARFLVNDLEIRTVTTVQLDTGSTSSLIGFATALAELGIGVSNLLYDEARTDLAEIVSRIVSDQPHAVSIYGPPLLAAQVYSRLSSADYEGVVSYRQATNPGFLNFVPSDQLPGIISATNWSFTSVDANSRQFVLDYLAAFGAVPDSSSAASYDAVGLIAEAFRGPGRLSESLAAIREFAGVQGILTPHSLSRGETSSNVAITRLNEYGIANVVVRLQANESISTTAAFPAIDTPTPFPTATPSGYHLTIQSTSQNVRSGPGLNYDVTGQVPRGTQARVLGATADYAWFVIDFQGQLGWLAAYLVDTFGNRNLVPLIQPPASPTPPATATAAPSTEPDLVIVNAYPNRITLDQPFMVNVIVENRGLSPSGPFGIATSFLPGGLYAGVNVPALPAGQQATVQLQQNLTGPTGPQSVIIVADLNRQVYEGAAGEANNHVFAFSYIADRPIISSGVWTIAAGSVDLDGSGNTDLTWTGHDLVAMNGGGFYLMTGFGSLDDVHHDAINAGLATASSLHVDLLRNAIVGMITPEGKRSVLQVTDVSSDGTTTFVYRVYR